MNEPRINVDHFYHRPVYHMVGLLTENSEIPAISKDLESAGVDLTAVEILCGERGHASWMSTAATTDCAAAPCGPFSGSATTRPP